MWSAPAEEPSRRRPAAGRPDTAGPRHHHHRHLRPGFSCGPARRRRRRQQQQRRHRRRGFDLQIRVSSENKAAGIRCEAFDPDSHSGLTLSLMTMLGSAIRTDLFWRYLTACTTRHSYTPLSAAEVFLRTRDTWPSFISLSSRSARSRKARSWKSG